ncbi:hypothetical protein [Actinomadura madurae]|uniref:hypothetical protein n=1 Tax=Actinomadura madurae TaxID=1993 RepID=UPI003557FAC7
MLDADDAVARVRGRSGGRGQQVEDIRADVDRPAGGGPPPRPPRHPAQEAGEEAEDRERPDGQPPHQRQGVLETVGGEFQEHVPRRDRRTPRR